MKKVLSLLLVTVLTLSLVGCYANDVNVENEILGRWIYATSSFGYEYWIHFHSDGTFDTESYRSGVIKQEHSGYYKINYDNSEIITFFITEDDVWRVFKYEINPYRLFNKVYIYDLKKSNHTHLI